MAGMVVLLTASISLQVSAKEYDTQDITEASAARFLAQATLGYSESDIKQVKTVGYRRWILEQLSLPASLTEPYIEFLTSRVEEDYDVGGNLLAYHKVRSAGNNVGYLNMTTAWMRAVLGGHDALRQRVAWALSQILVTSNRVNKLAEASTNYYDLLQLSAFDHYDELLLKVTYHPIMGEYLSYLGNQKANPSKNRYPDENYAREIMQLFTIGLWELNKDGTPRLNDKGHKIQSYNNEDIKQLARVFTGFWLEKARFKKIKWESYDNPMKIKKRHHDQGSKKLLNGYLDIPKRMDPDAEVELVISKLVNHRNTAPFISKKLINHLVTSNPSPDYIERVVNVWLKTDGKLSEVITAILVDPEARDPDIAANKNYGRLKGPILRLTNLLKAFNCGKELGKGPNDYPGLQWWNPEPELILQQAPMRAPSVFNFFDATYARPGPITDDNLKSPEFQILNDATAANIPNYFWQGLTEGFHKPRPLDKGDPLQCDLRSLYQLNDSQLMERVNLLLTGNSLSEHSISTILDIAKTSTTNRPEFVLAVVYATSITPEAAIQR